jgi:6-phosphogluconolactonase
MNLSFQSRSLLLILFLFALTFAVFPVRANAAGNDDLVYVGTYTGHGSQGIYSYRFDPATGKLAEAGLAAASDQPTFLAADPKGKFIYAINEIMSYNGKPTGAASAFAIDRNSGKLSPLNQVSSRDEGPAFITLDHSAKYAIVANYTLGSIAVLPILKDGRLGEATAFVQHKGSSVNPDRQKGPHAHAAVLSPDNRFVIVADLGLDQLIIYPFDSAKGTLGVPHVVKTHPGAGPRHLLFGPQGRFLYVINEMQSTVVTYRYNPAQSTLHELQTVSTLPKEFTGKNTAGEIALAPSGRFFYASNRGNDSIAVFARDPKNGTLKLVEFDSTQGKTPRSFAIDPTGRWLIAADQDSDKLVTFRINSETGHLRQTGETDKVSEPACVLFVPRN